MQIPKYIDQFRKELMVKNYGQRTIENYCSQIKCYLQYFEKTFTEPSKINEQSIKDYLLTSVTINNQRARHSAIKLFYTYVIRQPLKFKYIQYARKDKKLPIVLSQDDVQKMFSVCENLKHKVILALLYSCGLRVSELINLKWEHIDRSRMVINIIQGKGKKDRQVMLCSKLIPLLESYYREYKSKVYVLNGWMGKLQYTAGSVGQVIKQLAHKAGLKKRVWTHLMRHNSFTHLAESGVDINLIQRLAGHSSVKTTSLYLHLSNSLISKIPSPLNSIAI